MTSQNKTIALDIGGVCLNIHHDRCCRYFNYASLQEVPAELFGLAEQLEIGRLSEDQWLQQMTTLTQHRYSEQQILDGWNMIIGDEIQGMGEMVNDWLAKGYRLVYFSDTSLIHIREAYRKLNFAAAVTGAIFSYQVGARKPSAAMFEAFESKFGKPEFYLDDREENINAGLHRGWNAIQFRSVNELRQCLK